MSAGGRPLLRTVLAGAALAATAGLFACVADRTSTGASSTRQRSSTGSTDGRGQGRRAKLLLADRAVDMCLLLADTAAERELGLSRLRDLAPYDGMLFVFDHPERWQFWMKDTLIPLDLVPLREGGELSDPIAMTPCKGGTCPTYSPDFSYDRALELAEGRLGELGIVPAVQRTTLELSDTPCASS